MATFLTERFGWRTSLKKDAELYAYLRDTAGDDMDESESEVLRVVRARVFNRARAHTIEHSKGLRLLSRGLTALLYAPSIVIALGMILRAVGFPEILQLFGDCAQWVVVTIFPLGAIVMIWSMIDWFRWSKARDSLAVKSKLLTTRDHTPLRIRPIRR